MTFDGETYLRQIGDHVLAAAPGSTDASGARLIGATQALVASGVVDELAADSLLAHYRARMHRRAPGDPSVGVLPLTEGDPLRPRRLVLLDAGFKHRLGRWTLRYVSIGDDGLTLADVIRPLITASDRTGAPLFTSRVPASVQASTLAGSTVDVRDDHGTAATIALSPTRQAEWRGLLHSDRPLRRDTRWIEIDQERIALQDRQTELPKAWISTAAPHDPARRHLAQLATANEPDQAETRAAVDALIAAGVLQPEAHQLDEPSGPPQLAIGARCTTPAIGTLRVGAVTPTFNRGANIAIPTLTATGSRWELEIEASPPAVVATYDSHARRQVLTWRTTDSVGNAYTGFPMASTEGRRAYGVVLFGPELDRAASYVDVTMQGHTDRATVRIPLNWTRARPVAR